MARNPDRETELSVGAAADIRNGISETASPKRHLRESQTDSINPQVIKADFMKTATQSDHAVRI